MGQAGATLAFHSPDPGLSTVVLALDLPGLVVSRQVFLGYGATAQSLVDFFDRLALDWRGWDGPRTWLSSDDVQLVCWHDRIGHVTVQVVELGDDPVHAWHEPRWKVSAQVIVDPGALEAVSVSMHHLFEEEPEPT